MGQRGGLYGPWTAVRYGFGFLVLEHPLRGSLDGVVGARRVREQPALRLFDGLLLFAGLAGPVFVVGRWVRAPGRCAETGFRRLGLYR